MSNSVVYTKGAAGCRMHLHLDDERTDLSCCYSEAAALVDAEPGRPRCITAGKLEYEPVFGRIDYYQKTVSAELAERLKGMAAAAAIEAKKSWQKRRTELLAGDTVLVGSGSNYEPYLLPGECIARVGTPTADPSWGRHWKIIPLADAPNRNARCGVGNVGVETYPACVHCGTPIEIEYARAAGLSCGVCR